MATVIDEIWNALGLRSGACVAFIGAGGKTTSILTLSEEATARGLTSVITTTTKIWPPASAPLVLETKEDDVIEVIRLKLEHCACVALGSRLADSGKLVGVESQVVCRLARSGVVDVVLCEADGAAGRSLKVHGPEEPVVPDCATSVGIVAGLDAFGQVPGPDIIHRFETFRALPVFEEGELVNASTYARILLLAASKLKPTVPVSFILNKADDPHIVLEANRVAGILSSQISHPRVVVTSHHPVRPGGAGPLRSAASGMDAHAVL